MAVKPKVDVVEEGAAPVVVMAPLITARLSGDKVGTFYRGDILPETVTPESLEHLKALELVK